LQIRLPAGFLAYERRGALIPDPYPLTPNSGYALLPPGGLVWWMLENSSNFFCDWLRFLHGCFHRCLALFWVHLYSAMGFNQIPPQKTLSTER
jgi:hypothetical protein